MICVILYNSVSCMSPRAICGGGRGYGRGDSVYTDDWQISSACKAFDMWGCGGSPVKDRTIGELEYCVSRGSLYIVSINECKFGLRYIYRSRLLISSGHFHCTVG